MKSIISLSDVPAFMFKIFILESSPPFNNRESILINEVLPQPVSPIIITGILALILNNINIILIKLSAVKTYFPTISSRVLFFLISSILSSSSSKYFL